MSRTGWTRRSIIELGALAAAALLLPAGSGCDGAGGEGEGDGDGGVTADAGPLPDGLTPSCEETEDNIEGPFYKAGAPDRDDLTEEGLPGVRLELTGTVYRLVDGVCTVAASAELDFWQSDDRGEEPSVYDNVGFRLRGKMLANFDGTYRLRTIIPGHYLNGAEFRPAHIHVKVRAPNGPLLTTQLYFAGDPFNASDPFIHPRLIMTLTPDGLGGQRARFDFVVA